MALAKPILTINQKADHYGQVVPMEDVEKIFEMVQGAVRIPLLYTARVTTGNMNARYCYGLTMDKQLMDALDNSFSLELLTKEEALEFIRKLDKEGLVHSVWTFKDPFHWRTVQLRPGLHGVSHHPWTRRLPRHVPCRMGGGSFSGCVQWLPTMYASMPVWGNSVFIEQ